jgi:hypothetical protein
VPRPSKQRSITYSLESASIGIEPHFGCWAVSRGMLLIGWMNGTFGCMDRRIAAQAVISVLPPRFPTVA